MQCTNNKATSPTKPAAH